MSNKAKASLVPKLRFPEFRGTGEWAFRKLRHVAVNLDNLRVPITSSERAIGDTPYYGASGVVDYVSGFIFNEDLLCVSEDGANLVARTYPIAFPISGKTWVNNHAHVLRFESTYTQKFVEVYLNSIKLDDFITGMAQPKLNKAMLDSIPIPYPDILEQKKIADCLSSLEELIAAQARKVDAFKTHKKGLMQQLFPREGETQPRLRSPEFQNSADWMIETLGQLAGYENGKAYEQDITANGKYVVVNSRFISTDGTARKYTDADFLIAKAGEVLMVLSDLPKGRALAKCFFVEANDRYAVNQRVCRLKPTRIDGRFLYYVLNRHLRLLAFDDGLNQTHLSKGSVTECPLCVPPTIEEQQSIASCLTSLDNLITAEAQELEILKTHKNGLMQQLFPSLEETT